MIIYRYEALETELSQKEYNVIDLSNKLAVSSNWLRETKNECNKWQMKAQYNNKTLEG